MAHTDANKHETVMVIDDDTTLLSLVHDTLSEAYRVIPLPSAARMMEALDVHKVDLILLDVHMPGIDGYAAIKKLKAHHATQAIPVIFLTGESNATSEVKALSLGATDYLTKPFAPQLLRKRVDMCLALERQKSWLQHRNDDLFGMVDKYMQEITSLQHAIISVMGEMLEVYRTVPVGHVNGVQRRVEAMVGAMVTHGLYVDEIVKWKLDFLVASASIYDLGKPVVGQHVLHKRDALSREEWEEVRKHVPIGEAIIDRLAKRSGNSDFLTHAKKFAGYHHERWDGTGYPYGLKGDKIPLEGRIMAIVDAYNAIVSHRPHRQPRSHEEAVRIITEGAGTHFDPHLVRVFRHEHEKFRIPDAQLQAAYYHEHAEG